MSIVDLVPLFDTLVHNDGRTTALGSFLAEGVPGYDRHRIAVTERRKAALLVAMADEVIPPLLSPLVRLENLSVEWDRECEVTTSSGATEAGRYTVICCTDETPELTAYFLRVAGALVATLGPTPRSRDVARALESLIELFRALTIPPKESVQGLWGELYLMAQASDPVRLAAAWHVRPEELFDFSEGTELLEVKSAAGYDREHHFSLDQLGPRVGATIVVASLFVVRVGAGLSLRELVDRLRVILRAEPHLVLKIETVVGVTMGTALREALDETFDEAAAASSLAFYSASTIPTVLLPIPSEVSAVRFKVDLSFVAALDLSQHASRSLHAAAKRR